MKVIKFLQALSAGLYCIGIAYGALPIDSGPECHPAVHWNIITPQAPHSPSKSLLSNEEFSKLETIQKQYLLTHPIISSELVRAIKHTVFDVETLIEISNHPDLINTIDALRINDWEQCSSYFHPQAWKSLESFSVDCSHEVNDSLWQTLEQLPQLQTLHINLTSLNVTTALIEGKPTSVMTPNFSHEIIKGTPKLPKNLAHLSLTGFSTHAKKLLALTPHLITLSIYKMGSEPADFDDDVEFPQELAALSIIGLGITKIPAGVSHLKHLTKLEIGACADVLNYMASSSSFLPVQKFTPLIIDDAFSLPKTIESINFSCCNLKKLPQCLLQLPNLKILDLSYNPDIEIGDNIQLPPKIFSMGLAHCNLKKIPASVLNLPSLLVLSVGDNDPLTIDDTTIFPQSLAFLSLSSCGLRKIPTGILHLPILQGLEINNNRMIHAHLDVNLAWQNSIQVLDMAGCNLLSIPRWVAHLTTLKMLRLDCNPITDWTTNFACRDSLKYLFLTQCNLQQLPPWVSSLPTLKALDASGNANLNIKATQSLQASLEILCWDDLYGKDENAHFTARLRRHGRSNNTIWLSEDIALPDPAHT